MQPFAFQAFVRLVLWGAVLAVAVFAFTPMARAFTGIEPFLGQWLGDGVTAQTGALQNVDYRGTDLDVQIYQKGPESFIVSQKDVLWSADDNEVQKSITLVFEPMDMPLTWRAQEDCSPVAGRGCAWAHIKGETLTITVLSFERNDRSDFRVYKRTLTDDGLKLAYSHVVDGQLVETLGGFAVRQIN